MSQLILSVVIPTYNSEAFIGECLQSIECAAQQGVEFILVDGASSDRTMELVDRYKALFTYVISEPDRGQSNAFNKGFKLAKGKYLTWLNSDDVLFSGALDRVLSILDNSTKDWLVANCIYLDAKGKVMRCCRSGGFERFAVKDGILNVFGPSTFFSKKLYQEIGDFDESFHYCMDTEYWWRIVKSGHIYERINTYFWGLRLHSDAKTANVLLKNEYPIGMLEESRRISKLYYPNISSLHRKRGAFKARLWRLINLSYPRAAIDTLVFKGKPHKAFMSS